MVNELYNIIVDNSILLCYHMVMKKIYKKIKNGNLIHGRTSVYNVNYHIVWTIKYRRKVLTSEIETELKNICKRLGEEHNFTVQLLEVENCDYVHCFVSAPPKVSISEIVKILKGSSARLLFTKFPELKKQLYKNTLWNPSYYVETVGSISDGAIRKYIESQSKK